MSSILFAKHVSFEHSISSPSPCHYFEKRKTTTTTATTRPKFFSTQSTVSLLHAPSSAGTWCLHVLSELGRGAASFLATESTGTVLLPRLMTRIAGHGLVFPCTPLMKMGKKTSSGMTPSTCVFIGFLPFLLFWTCCTHRYRRMSGPRHTMWIKLCVPQFPCWVIQLSVSDWLLWKRCTTQLLYK